MHYTSQKMIQHRYDPSEPDMPHWCVALVPDDDMATVTFLRGKDVQRLTLAQAEKKAETLNERLKDH
jgi:hypothetical protein